MVNVEKGQSTRRKPAELIYGVDDPVPLYNLLALSIQHAALLISSLVATVFVARALDASVSQTESLVNVGLIAGGMACILQATSRWKLGSGYFCLHTSSFIYFQSSVLAAKTAGFPLVFGMTAIAGFAEAALSRIMPRLRVLLPPEISGLAVVNLGIAMAPYALKSMAGIGQQDSAVNTPELITGLVTLGLIVALNVWSKGMLRLYSMLISILGGYIAYFLAGTGAMDRSDGLATRSFLALPHLEHPGFSLDIAFLLPFLIAALCASLKLTGDIISCQKINDANWSRVDMNSVGRGLVADGLGTMAAGLMGGTGLASSSSNIGMSYATGATSRYLGYSTGAVFIALAFLPRISAILTTMPRPIIGAIVLYSSCFMIVTGWSIIMTRMLDARKIFVIGLSLILGLSVDNLPQLYVGVPNELKPIFSSSLALSTISAILLNLLFRIGISSKAVLELQPGQNEQRKIYEFFELKGTAWGARKDVVNDATAAMSELYESMTMLNLARGPVTATLSFDEFHIDLEVTYEGDEMCFPKEKPSPDAIISDPTALAGLSGYLIGQYADSIKTRTEGNQCTIFFRFDH
jgi:NCS2 family nucleobase:cation symporter-2